jgi:acyl-CoA thioesterase I
MCPATRRSLLLLPLSLLIPGLLAAGCGPAVPVDGPGTTIVAFGDSITSGVGAGPGAAYPDALARHLGIEVINHGVPGDTAEAGLARVEEVLADDPWLVILELGGNDVLRRVPPERTEAALRGILDRLAAARVSTVLVELEVPFGGAWADVYPRLADDYDVVLIDDVLGDILTEPTLKADTIHPNAAGYERLAAALAAEIAPLVKARLERAGG